MTIKESSVAWTRSGLVCLGLAILLSACGNKSRFSTKSDTVPPEPPSPSADSSQASKANGPFRGYDQPDIKGSGSNRIDGSIVFGAPVDPDEQAEVTNLENGDPTRIGPVKSLPTDQTGPLTCPGGLRISSKCLYGIGVHAWKLNGAPDGSSIMHSSRSQQCDTSGDNVCAHLKAKVPRGYVVSAPVFRSLSQAEAQDPLVSSLATSITICHGSSNREGGSSIASNSAQCATVTETLWGFQSAQSRDGVSTVPLFLWQKDDSDILSLSGTVAPAAGFVAFPQPVLHVLAPAP
jgi:hypothetical protein